jgi:hypothetical protein
LIDRDGRNEATDVTVSRSSSSDLLFKEEETETLHLQMGDESKWQSARVNTWWAMATARADGRQIDFYFSLK